MADGRYVCDCGKTVTATKNMRYRTHKTPEGEPCDQSSCEIPPREEEAGPVPKGADPGVPEEGRDYAVCPECGRKVALTRLGYYENHDKTLRGADRCQQGGTRYRKKIEDVHLPGDAPSSESAPAEPAPDSAATSAPPTSRFLQPPPWEEPTGETVSSSSGKDPSPATASPESTTTSKSSEGWSESSAPGGMSNSSSDSPQRFESETFQQPGSPFMQPGEIPVKVDMTERGKEIAARIKETFYAYSNRKTSDNRSAQTTMGPSEIGTPCDRRLAMALLGVVPVNPGGDGWAAFVGTQMHRGMQEIYEWADAGTGRYATELSVSLPSQEVPHGTTDLLDRVMVLLVDWKGMGEYSLKKFKQEGPSQTYRVQAHSYGYGAVMQGEKVKEVAIVGLPRAGRSLEEMHVWVEKFDKKIAIKALERVKKIREEIDQMSGQVAFDGTGPATALEAAETFSTATAYECTYCPFHLKGDKEMLKGCPGV